jgi:hypothetical protein
MIRVFMTFSISTSLMLIYLLFMPYFIYYLPYSYHTININILQYFPFPLNMCYTNSKISAINFNPKLIYSLQNAAVHKENN